MEIGILLATMSKNLPSNGHHSMPSSEPSTPSASVVVSVAAVAASPAAAAASPGSYAAQNLCGSARDVKRMVHKLLGLFHPFIGKLATADSALVHPLTILHPLNPKPQRLKMQQNFQLR
jgi:hypothetical protein